MRTFTSHTNTPSINKAYAHKPYLSLKIIQRFFCWIVLREHKFQYVQLLSNPDHASTHTDNVHVYNVHVYNVHVYNVHVYNVHVYNVHVYNVHVYNEFGLVMYRIPEICL